MANSTRPGERVISRFFFIEILKLFQCFFFLIEQPSLLVILKKTKQNSSFF
jgi:hypothetical protein